MTTRTEFVRIDVVIVGGYGREVTERVRLAVEAVTIAQCAASAIAVVANVGGRGVGSRVIIK